MKELECSQHYTLIFHDPKGSVICGGISPKFELIKLSCMSSLLGRMKKIQLKMKALECSQDFSDYKSMEINPGAQEQLTLQSMVGSGQISNSSVTL